jgi:hypothetical protein
VRKGVWLGSADEAGFISVAAGLKKRFRSDISWQAAKKRKPKVKLSARNKGFIFSSIEYSIYRIHRRRVGKH